MSETAKAVRAWIEARSDEMAELLARLVAEENENPPGRGMGRCARLLADEMERLGLDPELLEITGEHTLEEPYVVRGTAGEGDELIYFHGHYDVVPAQDRAQFTAERGDGIIVGRGTADMKGGIVSMLYGAAAAKELGLIPAGRIVFHLVPDEETGSVVGAGHLRDNELIDASALAMLTAEPSASSIWHAARGAISLTVTVEGVEAHVGQASFGENSFAHLVHIAQPVLDHADEMAQRHTTLNMDPQDPPGSMIVVGGLFGGGSNFNVVPGESWFTIDGRFNPEEDLEKELDRLQTMISSAADEIGARVRVDVTQFQPPASTPLDEPVGRALAARIEQIQAEPARFEMCAGILETRWYDQLGIPAFGYGPGRLDVSHGPREFVDELRMQQVAMVYALFAHDQLS